MNEAELQVILQAMLPLVRMEERPADGNKIKYMIGTLAHTLLIKGKSVMLRVGGGYASLEEHIKQVGPFECIKIYKLMKGGPKQAPMTFTEAVVFYLKKLKCPDRIMKNYLDVNDND